MHNRMEHSTEAEGETRNLPMQLQLNWGNDFHFPPFPCPARHMWLKLSQVARCKPCLSPRGSFPASGDAPGLRLPLPVLAKHGALDSSLALSSRANQGGSIAAHAGEARQARQTLAGWQSLDQAAWAASAPLSSPVTSPGPD